MSTLNLSPEEIDKMRRLIAEHDTKNRGGDIDLSKPIVDPNYRYQDHPFPKMIYDHAKATPAHDVEKQTKNGREMIHVPANLGGMIVRNQAELSAALAAGYSLKPPTWELEVVESDESWEASEAVQPVTADYSEPPIVEAPRRGRPRKEAVSL